MRWAGLLIALAGLPAAAGASAVPLWSALQAAGPAGQPAPTSPFEPPPPGPVSPPVTACLRSQSCARVQPCPPETGCSRAAEAAVLATLRSARTAAADHPVDNADVRLALFYLSRYGFPQPMLDGFWTAAGTQDAERRISQIDGAFAAIAQAMGMPAN